LPVGFPADPPVPPNPPMVEAAVNRKRADGQPQYARSIQRVTDTAAPDAMLRNAITFSAETAVVLSAPATWLARSVALAGSAAQYRQHVKRIVIVEAGDLERDTAAMHSLMTSLAIPAVSVGADIGKALVVPLDRVHAAFMWSPANPVADAVDAARAAEVPLQDVAAVHYAVYPDSGLFTVSGGRLAINPSKQSECVDALLALATAKPASPGARGG